jgi:hypothetical protein
MFSFLMLLTEIPDQNEANCQIMYTDDLPTPDMTELISRTSKAPKFDKLLSSLNFNESQDTEKMK